jgi:hypothetical protein
MNRTVGLILLSATWLAVGGCEQPPGPAAEGMPSNEGQGGASELSASPDQSADQSEDRVLAEGQSDGSNTSQSGAGVGQADPARPASQPPQPPSGEPPVTPGY